LQVANWYWNYNLWGWYCQDFAKFSMCFPDYNIQTSANSLPAFSMAHHHNTCVEKGWNLWDLRDCQLILKECWGCWMRDRDIGGMRDCQWIPEDVELVGWEIKILEGWETVQKIIWNWVKLGVGKTEMYEGWESGEDRIVESAWNEWIDEIRWRERCNTSLRDSQDLVLGNDMQRQHQLHPFLWVVIKIDGLIDSITSKEKWHSQPNIFTLWMTLNQFACEEIPLGHGESGGEATPPHLKEGSTLLRRVPSMYLYYQLCASLHNLSHRVWNENQKTGERHPQMQVPWIIISAPNLVKVLGTNPFFYQQVECGVSHRECNPVERRQGPFFLHATQTQSGCKIWRVKMAFSLLKNIQYAPQSCWFVCGKWKPQRLLGRIWTAPWERKNKEKKKITSERTQHAKEANNKDLLHGSKVHLIQQRRIWVSRWSARPSIWWRAKASASTPRSSGGWSQQFESNSPTHSKTILQCILQLTASMRWLFERGYLQSSERNNLEFWQWIVFLHRAFWFFVDCANSKSIREHGAPSASENSLFLELRKLACKPFFQLPEWKLTENTLISFVWPIVRQVSMTGSFESLWERRGRFCVPPLPFTPHVPAIAESNRGLPHSTVNTKGERRERKRKKRREREKLSQINIFCWTRRKYKG